MMVPFESAVRGSLEGSRGDRVHVPATCRADEHRNRATPLCGTQLPRPIVECQVMPIAVWLPGKRPLVCMLASGFHGWGVLGTVKVLLAWENRAV